MEWLENLADELPAPRSDEPPDLRRRILAEVRDHLETAWQRELLRSGDEVQARQNVLVRFGDPARIARKLYFDAMWEKIMMQRGMLVALVAMVLICAGSMGLTWFMVLQAGQVNQAILEQNRAVNERILARLELFGQKTDEPAVQSGEWCPLKIHATWENSDGAPAVGVKVEIMGGASAAGTATEQLRVTGPDGVADFGLVRPGQYLINAQLPSGETIADKNSMALGMIEISGMMLAVAPGNSPIQELICPAPAVATEVAVVADWPTELKDRDLWLICELTMEPRDAGGHQWAQDEAQKQYVIIYPNGDLSNPPLLIARRGTVATSMFAEIANSHFDQEEETRYFVTRQKTFIDSPGIYRVSSPDPGPYRDARFDPLHIWLPKTDVLPQIKIPAGTYRISRIIVGRDEKSAKFKPPEEGIDLPDDLWHPEFIAAIELAGAEESSDKLIFPNETRARHSRRKRREIKADLAKFTVVAGRRDSWSFPIPPRLADILLEPEIADSHDPDLLNPADFKTVPGAAAVAPSLKPTSAGPRYELQSAR